MNKKAKLGLCRPKEVPRRTKIMKEPNPLLIQHKTETLQKMVKIQLKLVRMNKRVIDCL